MDRLEILDRAAAGFALALAQVEPDQWDAPTGNEGRTVRGLVDHVVGGDHMATVLLHGGTRAEASAQFVASADGTDLVVAFDEAENPEHQHQQVVFTPELVARRSTLG